MKRRIFFALLTLSILSLALFSCAPRESTTGVSAGAAGNEIRVGEYGSLTGSTATFGQSTHNGIVLALDEVNAAGGINGRPIRLFTEDDQSKPEEAANVVQKLISQNRVVAVLGEVASSRSLAAAPICQENRIPMLTPSSTNPQVTQIGDYIFRACFIDPYQGESLARFAIEELKVRRAAILTDVKNDYSVGLAKFFKEAFNKMGGQVVGEQSYSEGDSDFKGQLTALRASNPDVIFVPGYYTEVGQIAIQTRDLGMTMPMLGGDGWESPKLLEIGGKALNGSYYSNHYSPDDPDPVVRTFVDKYRERFGANPDSLAALGYDSMKILAEAMTRAKEIDSTLIRDELARTANFKGVTGTITMGPDRNPIKSIVILEIRDGQITKRTEMHPPGMAPPPAAAGAPQTTTGEVTPGSPAPVTETASTPPSPVATP
ncbi:MAG TPA: ABC transporter substrate-binding protein [Thermoanaerobaculia bacterium]|nr:ABC transporter substrate-binding protein [Thermoanaerobaculia bacterium]